MTCLPRLLIKSMTGSSLLHGRIKTKGLLGDASICRRTIVKEWETVVSLIIIFFTLVLYIELNSISLYFGRGVAVSRKMWK